MKKQEFKRTVNNRAVSVAHDFEVVDGVWEGGREHFEDHAAVEATVYLVNNENYI